ncbi:DUF6544 family protein [Negadavirga shengliensis]|uniref:DUF6544 family protein n=1 Tax=Negadavirga shengliensis TaxID=1389218 RepID=A0ABV9T6X2_9BACT
MILLLTCFLYFLKYEYWWLFALAGVGASQTLILTQWPAAKYGTIPTLIILFVAVVSIADHFFEKSNSRIRDRMTTFIPADSVQLVTEEDIKNLPDPVLRWLRLSGAVGKPYIQSVEMKQKYEIKLREDQTKWFSARATQYSTIQPPAFLWSLEMRVLLFLPVKGRDSFQGGEGSMMFKMFSLVPIARATPDTEINQSALQRFLGEIAWYPSAALCPEISWEPVDDVSAKATMEFQGTKGSGVFHFDPLGNLKKFTALRYMDAGDKFVLREWQVEVIDTKEFDGIIIPSKCRATWKMDDGDWNWANFEVLEAKYH